MRKENASVSEGPRVIVKLVIVSYKFEQVCYRLRIIKSVFIVRGSLTSCSFPCHEC